MYVQSVSIYTKMKKGAPNDFNRIQLLHQSCYTIDFCNRERFSRKFARKKKRLFLMLREATRN